MNKTEMIAAIAEKADLTKKDAEKALKAFTDTVIEASKAPKFKAGKALKDAIN